MQKPVFCIYVALGQKRQLCRNRKMLEEGNELTIMVAASKLQSAPMQVYLLSWVQQLENILNSGRQL
jgi:F0F1-type ATP synthase alpha subunit